MKKLSVSISPEQIERAIFYIRGAKVMLDRDIAFLYGVSTSQLNKAVSRNKERFPPDFMFQLNPAEFKNLMFQIGTSSWGGSRKLPRVFTEQGIAMLSGVLRSRKAAQMNIRIMRAFIKLREFLSTHKELAQKLVELEGRVGKHESAIRKIMKNSSARDRKPKGPIGFQP